MVQTADTIFRDFETDGVPASGTHKPKKSEIRPWAARLENLYSAAQAGGGLAYETKAAMDADLAHGANQIAWVMEDPTAANNGIYAKVGASGSGSWNRLGDLPYSYIKASNAGAGTANAIVATTSIPIPAADGGALIALPIVADNTASPVTVSFNGEAALTVKTSSGNDVSAGGLTAGMIAAGYVSGATFRLLTDQASAAVVADAVAAADRAEAATASVEVIAKVDPRWSDFGAIGDGNSHPLSNYYATLAEAQVDFPQATALTDERDMCAIVKMIGLGQKIYLSGNARYRWNRQQIFTTNGLFIDGDGTATILPDMSVFTNTTRVGSLGSTGCPILFKGPDAATPLEDIRVSGIRMDGQNIESRRTKVMGFLNCKNIHVSHNEMVNFCVGAGIAAERIFGDRSKFLHNKIRDWYSDDATWADKQTSQATGIDIDDGDAGTGLRSERIEVAYNEIYRLVKGPTIQASALGIQTDGINVQSNLSKNGNIHHNCSDGVDEGIDCFGTGYDIMDNESYNATGAGVKLIHGASNNRVGRNLNVGYTLRGMAVFGGDVAQTTGNHIFDNRFRDGGAGSHCLDIGETATGFACTQNYFSGNDFNPGSGASAIHSTLLEGDNFFTGDIFPSAGTGGWITGADLPAKNHVKISSPQKKTVILARLPSGGQTFTSTTGGAVLFSTEGIDARNEYDGATATVTFQIKGEYRIKAMIRAGGWPATSVSLVFRKNGTAYVEQDYESPTTPTLTFDRTVSIDEGDTGQMFLVFGVASSATLTGGLQYSELSIEKL